MSTILINAASFVFIISIIVFIHEFGHYIVAKWAGVKIETFSIGFGKEIYGWNDKSGTRWRIALLPLGGFVKMYGDASEASNPSSELDKLSDEEKKQTFHFKPLHKKSAVVFAGPLANFVLTIAIYTMLMATYGLPSSEPVVDVKPGSAAQEAGLLKGDKIISINGNKVASFFDIQRYVITNLGTEITLVYEREGVTSKLKLTPRMIDTKDAFDMDVKIPQIGVSPTQLNIREIGIGRAFIEAIKATYQTSENILITVGQLVTGKRDANQIQGPISIAKYSGKAVQMGWLDVLRLMAALSVSLGIVNLLPIPVLDGGHLLFYGIEAIRRKPMAPKAQEYCFRVGMAMISMLMMYAIINDISKLLPALSPA